MSESDEVFSLIINENWVSVRKSNCRELVLDLFRDETVSRLGGIFSKVFRQRCVIIF